MSVIKSVFGKLVKFIKESVWLQPILVVGLIFALIFSLNGIVQFFNSIGEWFNGGNNPKNELKVEQLKYSEIEDKFLNGEKFIFVIGADTCSNCIAYYDALNKYYNEQQNNPDLLKIYYLNITRYEETGEYKDDSIPEDAHLVWYEERIYPGTNDKKWLGKSGFATPTTVFVSNQEVVYAVEGPMTVADIKTKSNLID